eukprot:g45074.t1
MGPFFEIRAQSKKGHHWAAQWLKKKVLALVGFFEPRSMVRNGWAQALWQKKRSHFAEGATRKCMTCGNCISVYLKQFACEKARQTPQDLSHVLFIGI